MADDIDIEEHDVLDNPRIKNIFPDIASIKTEVIDYEEEGIVDNNDENYQMYQHDDTTDFQEDIPSLYQNRIILGSRLLESSESSSDSTDEYETVPNIVETSVVLEDWGLLLSNNPCYCRSCQILFPTVNALDSHKMTAHSFLIVVPRNKAIKSTSKSSISAKLKFEPDPKTPELEGNLCSHCYQVFPDEIALLKHSYELLPRKFTCDYCDMVFDNEAVCKIHAMTHSVAVVLCCPICSCHFKYTHKLMTHVTHQHKTVLNSFPERIRTNYKCSFCSMKMKDNKTYNAHIFHRHADLYGKIVKDRMESDKFKCIPCNLSFPSAYSEKIHLAAQHANRPASVLSKSSSELNIPVKIEPQSPKKPSTQEADLSRRPVPKSNLFKCNKCQIYFLSSQMAFEHTKRCVLKKGEWKCKQCRRSFKLVDREMHHIQHKFTERFKIIVIQENLLNKILCRCKSCKVCFDERTLLKYHLNGCTKNNSVPCSVCNVHVHVHAMSKHKRIHNEMGAVQFVIIDYVSIDELNTTTETPNVSESRKEKAYYYCPTCKCYMKVNKLTDKHNIGQCSKDRATCLCKICGLKFSCKGYLTHKKEHKKYPSLKLSDLTFKNTENNMLMCPPFPDFKTCNICHVKFFSTLALRSHTCNVEQVKTCVYCGEKYSDLAYKLHVPFHEYSGNGKNVYKEGVPELIKKYESLKIIWNILFLCEVCDTASDNYDEIVEHSQNHFCNIENYNVTINHCNICNLKIIGKCYDKHKKLHLAKTVSKSSFKIVPYKYDTLLSDTWHDMFETLAKVQIDQILYKSKYNYTRAVRMELLADGPIDMTIYKCDVCQCVIDKNEVADHVNVGYNCALSTTFTCVICHMNFPSKSSQADHISLHETGQIDNGNIRIISFNNENDAFINDSLRSKMNPESLKFIRCQYCGKLINKAKYKKHVQYHKNYERKTKGIDKTNLKKNQPKFLVRTKFKKAQKPIVHRFYKCKKCGLCVFKKTFRKHLCSSNNHKRQCPKCELFFRMSHFNKHLMYHEKFKFTKKNVHVFIFNNGTIENEDEAKVTLYQCSDCSVCLHREMNIKRHICISSNYQKKCQTCEMPFHCSRMQIHEKFHEDKDFTKKNIIVKKFKNHSLLNVSETSTPVEKQIKIEKAEVVRTRSKNNTKLKYKWGVELKNREFLRHTHVRFFKCTCKLLFVTSASFLEHVSSCQSDNAGVKCDKCGLIFHKSEINLHKKINKCLENSSTIYVVTMDNGNNFEYDNAKCLYYCYKCDINYLTFRAVFNHIQMNHVVKMSGSDCELCGVTLSMRTYPQHKKIHHKLSHLKLSDLNHYKVVDMKLGKALKDLPDAGLVNITNYVPDKIDHSDQDIRAVKRKLEIESDDEKHKKLDIDPDNGFKNQNPVNVFNLHPCHICDLNFLQRKTLLMHLANGQHIEKRIVCKKCGLKFTKISLTRHLKMHHHSFNNINYTNYETIENSSNHDKRPEVDKPNINNVRTDVQKPTVIVDTVKDTQQSQQTINKITNKLYKCSECDVYYLYADACFDHVANHMALDPTEYIACKVCDLQFLCEYLGSHMKCHREKTFNIDEIIVEEYQFRGGEIKIDSYSAADRLKSKLVTTTTHFDMENEKNDESVVDSTVPVSEEIENVKSGIVTNDDEQINERINDVDMIANSDAENMDTDIHQPLIIKR